MGLILTLILVFLVMLLLPIVLSIYFLRKKNGKVLNIQQSKVRDPRYFVKSYTRMFDENWKNYSGSGKMMLSHEENIIEADRVTDYPLMCTSVIYAENLEFRPPAGIRLEKEVYALQNAYFYGIDAIRSACSKKDLILGSGSQVLRWVDAEGALTVYDNCDLGISASSVTKIIIGDNCRFRRLYAPRILLGITPEEESYLHEDRENINLDNLTLDVFRHIKYVDDDIVDKADVLWGSIITKHDIKVLNNITIKGHIRSNKGIVLYDNVVIYGNIFAEGDIYLGQNVRVYGSVFTQESFFAQSGVTIGQYGKIKSVIARGKVIFQKNCRVYGYVNSEMGGQSSPDATTS